MHKSNLQKHETVSSTSNGKIIWPLALRSWRPIDEYRTVDRAFDAAPLPVRPTIVFSHITDDFSVVLLCRALHHCRRSPFTLVIVYVHFMCSNWFYGTAVHGLKCCLGFFVCSICENVVREFRVFDTNVSHDPWVSFPTWIFFGCVFCLVQVE